MKNLFLLVVMIIAAESLWAANGCDEINWQENKICVIAGGTADLDKAQSSAHARSMALRTARVLAYEKLAEKVKGVIVGAQTKLKNDALDESQVTTIVKATIRNVSFEKEMVSFLPDGSPWAEVTLSVPIYGKAGVSTKVLEYEQGRANNVTEDSSKGKVLIIDASSLSYDPGLFPKVVSKGGKQISNPNEPLRVFTDLKKAQTAAGSETLLIKADSVNDKNELIVNDEDAQKLLVNSGDLIIVR
jgi:hypothetical protein